MYKKCILFYFDRYVNSNSNFSLFHKLEIAHQFRYRFQWIAVLKKIVIDRRAAYSRYWRSLIDRYIIWRYWYRVPFMRNNSARIIQYASLGRFTQRSSIELSTNLSRSREPRYINISAGVIKGLNLFNYAPLYDQLASNWWIMLYI